MRKVLGLTIAALLSGGGTLAWADTPTPADALFAEGRALIGSGQVAEACAKFEASLALDAALGTRLNLGLCWEQLGRVLDAIGALEQVVADATTGPLAPFRNLAAEHLTALYARRSNLTVTITGDGEGVALTLQRPGAADRTLTPGAALVLDPSRDPSDVVTIVARRDDATTRSPPITLAPGGTASVAIDAPAAPQLVVAPVASRQVAASRRGWYVAGAGVLTLTAGAIVALVAKQRYDAAITEACDGPSRGCTEDGVNRTDAAITLARWGATPLALAGVAAVAIGVVLVVRDRRAVAVAPVIGTDHVGLAAVGRF